MYPADMARETLLLGYDIGSSSIKATLLDPRDGTVVAAASSPDVEMPISSPHPGWAEQDPELWWRHLREATTRLERGGSGRLARVAAVGISYQMHGLVVVDTAGKVLRPSIIWCDSRAVTIGETALRALGERATLERLLNSPGNFTASKLRWVREHEPEIYRRVAHAMLPGDWVAYRMTGELKTTVSGLSEGILWDFAAGGRASFLLDHYGIDPSIFPETVPTFGVQGKVSTSVALELGLPAGVPVSYRAGDQPNNALSLNVLHPGEIAATAGTSGVVYGVTALANHDPGSRVNTFVHVNHEPKSPSYGILLCVNGTGILWSWLKRLLGAGASYPDMNQLAAKAPVGADGLVVLPYGNGAERTLDNRDTGASVVGLSLTRHGPEHLLRAATEGIVFALRHGLDIMRGMGMEVRTVRAGNANLFLSPLFAQVFATTTGATVELYDTDGSQGAARGAGVGAGIYRDLGEAFQGLKTVRTVRPDTAAAGAHAEAFARWSAALKATAGS